MTITRIKVENVKGASTLEIQAKVDAGDTKAGRIARHLGCGRKRKHDFSVNERICNKQQA